MYYTAISIIKKNKSTSIYPQFCLSIESQSKKKIKIVCSPTELQKLRDEQCTIQWDSQRNSNCYGRFFARYDIGHIYSTPHWRCYYEEALTRDRRRFDTTKQSSCYHTTHNELESFTNEGKIGDKERCVV